MTLSIEGSCPLASGLGDGLSLGEGKAQKVHHGSGEVLGVPSVESESTPSAQEFRDTAQAASGDGQSGLQALVGDKR